eukprot:2349408-Pyramimonas_sp.AAC.1
MPPRGQKHLKITLLTFSLFRFRWAPETPKYHDGPKNAQKRPKKAPRGTLEATLASTGGALLRPSLFDRWSPRLPQEGGPQETPKRLPEAPNRAPRKPQDDNKRPLRGFYVIAVASHVAVAAFFLPHPPRHPPCPPSFHPLTPPPPPTYGSRAIKWGHVPTSSSSFARPRRLLRHVRLCRMPPLSLLLLHFVIIPPPSKDNGRPLFASLHAPARPRAGQLPWASFLDGLVGVLETPRIEDDAE